MNKGESELVSAPNTPPNPGQANDGRRSKASRATTDPSRAHLDDMKEASEMIKSKLVESAQ